VNTARFSGGRQWQFARAYRLLNIKRGISAPASGLIATNGEQVAEQIGAQISSMGWAIVAPGNPALAARLAEQAARVSHDGAAVEAASSGRRMEPKLRLRRLDHLIETASPLSPRGAIELARSPDVRPLAQGYADLARYASAGSPMSTATTNIPAICHVRPNHAVMMMALYRAVISPCADIVCTSGWATRLQRRKRWVPQRRDLGLDGIAPCADWRGPVADRMLISSRRGGAITDAVRTTYRSLILAAPCGQEPMRRRGGRPIPFFPFAAASRAFVLRSLAARAGLCRSKMRPSSRAGRLR